MKKLILTLVLTSFVFFGYTQDTARIDISQIPNEVGVLYEKAFIPIGKDIRGVEVQVLEVKDLINETTKRYIRVKHSVGGGYGHVARNFSAAINKVEAESLIAAMDKIVAIINDEKKFVYTEISFKTFEGLEVGAYYKDEEMKWHFYMEKDRSYYNSWKELKKDDFIKLAIYIREAYKKL